MTDREEAAASQALEKAARSLSKATDEALSPFVRAWEACDLGTAFDALRAAGEEWADSHTFWYELADAAEKLGRPGEAAAILDAHGA